MNHYYIYYRIKAKDAVESEELVRSMQARLACRSGISGRLMKKRDDPALWMEIYERVENPQRFERLLRQAVDEFDLDILPETPRTMECFTEEAAAGADKASAALPSCITSPQVQLP